jgi:hypothetical protein
MKKITIPLEYYRALEITANALSVLRDEGLREWTADGWFETMERAVDVFTKYQPDGDNYEDNPLPRRRKTS